MIKLKAINTIVTACPSGLSDVIGHRPDGTPLIKPRELYVYSGETFEIDAANAERLLELGVVTRDLSAPLTLPNEVAEQEADNGNI